MAVVSTPHAFSAMPVSVSIWATILVVTIALILHSAWIFLLLRLHLHLHPLPTVAMELSIRRSSSVTMETRTTGTVATTIAQHLLVLLWVRAVLELVARMTRAVSYATVLSAIWLAVFGSVPIATVHLDSAPHHRLHLPLLPLHLLRRPRRQHRRQHRPPQQEAAASV